MDAKTTKEDVMAQVKQVVQQCELNVRVEMETQLMQDIYNSITAKCFNKCVGKPADRLDKGEQTCLAKCVDRFLESRQVVTDTMIDRGSRK